MNDDSIVKIMQSLDLDYSKAVFSTMHFQKTIENLNTQLANMKANAMQSTNSVNSLFSSQLGQVTNNRTIVDQFGRPFRTIQDEARAAAQPISTLVNSMNNAGTSSASMGAQFASSAIQLHTLRRVAREVTETIKDVEMGMIEIQRVMTDSSFVFDDYRSSLLQLGIDYGQTFSEVQSIALRWAQSGYNVADSLELTKTSLLALNTAELNATQATEAMIGIMAQWNLQAEDMALVMDKVNITADRNAVTSQDLVDGLLRSSGAAKIMNLSLDETIGLLTVMREASGRTGREVGNALNSILSYIQRPGSIKTLENMGISMFADEAKTQFRNVMEVFQEIEAKWNTTSDKIKDGFVKSAMEAGLYTEELTEALALQEEWNDLQQRDISQSAAGTYRRNYFIGMIERLTDVQGVLNNLMDAEGYSMRENAKTMETLEKKTESLKAAAESLAVAVGETGLIEALKLLVDAGTGAIEMFNALPDEVQKPILAFVAMSAIIKTGQLAFTLYGISVNSISTALGGLTTSAGQAANATKILGLATNQWTLLLAGAAAVGSLIYTTLKKNNEELERNVEVLKNSNTIDDYVSKYEELASKSQLTTDEQQKLLEVKEKIKSLMPEVASAIDGENVSLEDQLKIIKELNKQQRENAMNQATSIVAKYGDKKESLINEIEGNEEGLKRLREARNELLKKQANGIELTRSEKQELKDLQQRIDITSEALSNNKAKVDSLNSSLDLINAVLNGNTEVIGENTNATDEGTKSNQDHRQSLEELNKKLNETTDKIADYNNYLKEYNKTGKFSGQVQQEIIDKYPALIGLLADERALRDGLKKGLAEEKQAQANLFYQKIELSNDFINTRVEGEKTLREKLAEYYNVDLQNAKNLAEAKELVENELISNLSEKWAKYYNAIIGGDTKVRDDIVRAAMMGDKNAAQILKAYGEYQDIQDRFKSVALELSGFSFDRINTSNIKSDKDKKYENKALDEALKLLEHRKRISEETQATIKAEIAELNRINSLYVKTADERMTMSERIYSAEKRLRDRTLQDSTNWINDKKNLNELSVEEEIAAWERVKKNQSNNIEAVKQATLNLHKLRNQLITESATKEENTIKHLAKIGIYSTNQQIDKYRELYSTRATSIEEERNRVENLFGLYKSLLSEQQKEIKDAYDERIKQIENEAKKKKLVQEDIIKGIEKELELLDRQEDKNDYDKKMSKLREELAYWQVRTSEDARKKVAELLKQIAEEEHKREVELKKQGLEDKKKIAQDEVKSIEETAKEEREKWEKSYDLVEKSFDDHSANIVALAGTMSKDAYKEWEKNYLTPLQNALSSGNYDSFDSLVGGLGGSINDLNDRVANSSNAQIHRAASSILELKKQWTAGDMTASQRATQYYNELEKLNPSAAKNLKSMDYETAQEYVKNLPKMHNGGKSLSYGAVEMMPGELTFPPDLSTKLESLIQVLYAKPINQTQTSSYMTDRRIIQNFHAPLFNSERTVLEDDVDERSLARELKRAIAGMA